MSESRRIVQVGLGPIGVSMARMAASREDLRLVGGVDVREDLAGKPLSEILEEESRATGEVVATVEEAISRFAPDAILLTTVSDLDPVVPLCESALRMGVAVVSTCEEMLYPWLINRELAERLDTAGREGGAACLGTGINPGFVLDFLPVVLAGAVDRVVSLRASRVVDAGSRRGALQKKVGAGLTPEEFEEGVRAGSLGHRGMLETLHLVCVALGVETLGGTTFIHPVIAEHDVETPFVKVTEGQVAGIHQGAEDREGRVVLDLKMYVGAENPADTIQIESTPPVSVEVRGGYQGDQATCAIALNAVQSVCAAEPGLRTMIDVPLVRGRMQGETSVAAD